MKNNENANETPFITQPLYQKICLCFFIYARSKKCIQASLNIRKCSVYDLTYALLIIKTAGCILTALIGRNITITENRPKIHYID